MTGRVLTLTLTLSLKGRGDSARLKGFAEDLAPTFSVEGRGDALVRYENLSSPPFDGGEDQGEGHL